VTLALVIDMGIQIRNQLNNCKILIFTEKLLSQFLDNAVLPQPHYLINTEHYTKQNDAAPQECL
jgi:hypothetical protein